MKNLENTIELELPEPLLDKLDRIATGRKSNRPEMLIEFFEAWIAYQEETLAEIEYLSNPSLLTN